MFVNTGISLKPSDAVPMPYPDGLNVGLVESQNFAVVVEAAPFDYPLNGTSSVEFGSDTDNPTPNIPVSPPANTQSGEDVEIDPAFEAAYKKQPLTPKMRRLTDIAIVTELVVGSPVEVIAKNYHVDVMYVQRIRSEWLKACKMQEAYDYRHEFKVLALEAVREGLLTKTDPFKRMQGGIKTLQGIGEFKPDTVNVAVLQRIENVPAELRGRYLTSTVEDEKAILEAELVTSEVTGK